ncbi:MAG: response regulator [Nitrospira sp.]|nr:response regulator [Nitrospira sp.]MDH4369830.1 response regulator [Nitrospira sp.]MDH5347293.1 response regulator [Nitrospira sp.]MDH5497300.1 response regulator [Nitrospira sp.]MDH5725609.1 response regulator [Nitrospira sp.]
MKNKILLVEDEVDTANLLKSVLEREGFSVIQAKDGRQARTLVDTTQPPSLVLLDLVLPYVSGSELLKLIRHHPDWQYTPIIVLSADSHEPDIQRALDDGATAYVTKQKGSKVLLQEVRRVMPTPVYSALAPDQTVKKETATALRKRRTSGRHRPRGSQRKKRAA